MSLDPFAFLESVEEFTPRQDRHVRLATVYTMHADGVRVTFDGESSPTLKRYLLASPGNVVAGDRVVMLAVGQSWVVLGALEATPSEDYAAAVHTHAGAGASFLETTGHNVTSGTVTTIAWNSADYSYGPVAERPSLATGGNIDVPPGVWNVSYSIRLSGSGTVARMQNVIRDALAIIAANEHPVNASTNVSTVNATIRLTSAGTIHTTTFQDSGLTKTVNSLSRLSIDRLAAV